MWCSILLEQTRACQDRSSSCATLLTVSNRYCEDLGETLCPPDRAGMVDVTQRVAAESSFALAKGNVGYTVFSRSMFN